MPENNKINPLYKKQIEQIKIDGEDFANEKMKDVHQDQNDKLDEIKKYLGLLYVAYAVNGLLHINQFIKNNVVSKINDKLTSIGKDLGNREVNKVTDILKTNYKDTYYKNAFIMDQGLKVNLKFNLLRQEFIDSAVNTPIKGEMFSDRIWANKSALIDTVKQELLKAMQGDTTIDQVGKQIQQAFNVHAYQSHRLVNTENARIQSQAQNDIGVDAGCTEQMYSATLDNMTSPECAALDNHVYGINDPDKVVPPENHPNCRCVLINMPPTGWQPTIRKDNTTKDYIDYQAYGAWAKSKGI